MSFDDGLEVRGVFLDISKAFDKVWHKGLIYKLKQNGIIEGNLLDTLINFPNDRKQRVVLNGKYSIWANIEAGAPQGSVLGPLIFFSVINDKHSSANKLNQNLNKINNWAFKWKMSLYPDPSKQAQEVIFSRKLQKSTHPMLSFNNNTATQSVTEKHLEIMLDTKLDFQGHLKSILNKVNKTIGLSRKLHNTLPRLPLLTLSHLQDLILTMEISYMIRHTTFQFTKN